MKPSQVIPQKIRGLKFPNQSYTYNSDQTILYALSIGFSRDPLNHQHLNYTYQLSQNFQVFPTFGVSTMDFAPGFQLIQQTGGLPDFNLMMLLHGEHKIEIFKPFPANQRLTVKTKILDVADKGKGVLLTFQSDVFDEENQLLFRNIPKLFIRGLGGFGDKGQLKNFLPPIPKSSPDISVTEKTEANQAILYRLVRDKNPLHISPEMASLGGFERPILHGLCFYGIATKHILGAFCNLDSKRLKSIQARFASHVFPGDTLVTDMWRKGCKIYFSQKTLQRQKVCCHGIAEIHPEKSPNLQQLNS